MSSKTYYVYIATNRTNTVLYTGVTNNLIRRIHLHKTGLGSIFTKRYKVNKLVYFEKYSDIYLALSREKQIKSGSRVKKLKLIKKNNSKFADLFDSIIQ